MESRQKKEYWRLLPRRAQPNTQLMQPFETHSKHFSVNVYSNILESLEIFKAHVKNGGGTGLERGMFQFV